MEVEEAPSDRKRASTLLLNICHPTSVPRWALAVKRCVVAQKFRYTPTRQVLHLRSGLCLDAGAESGGDARAAPCMRAPARAQVWDIDYSERDDFHRAGRSLLASGLFARSWLAAVRAFSQSRNVPSERAKNTEAVFRRTVANSRSSYLLCTLRN